MKQELSKKVHAQRYMRIAGTKANLQTYKAFSVSGSSNTCPIDLGLGTMMPQYPLLRDSAVNECCIRSQQMTN